MGILEIIKEDLLNVNLKIVDIRIGLSYVGVVLENRSLGLAYIFLPEEHKCYFLDDLWPIKGKMVCDVVDKLSLEDEISSSIIVACANSCYNLPDKNYIFGDIMDVVDMKDCVVAMVGEFKPLVDPIKKTAKKLYVFEKREKLSNGLFSEEKIDLIKNCDVVIITATSIINMTIDKILDFSKNAKETIILGPSTPLNERYFISTSTTLLCGVVVDNKNISSVLDIISIGGGMRSFNRFVKKACVRL